MVENELIVKSKEIGKDLSKNTNVFFDFFRGIDYYFQGKRSAIFIFGAFVIVLFAPIIDYVILPRRLSLTSIATYFYLLFFLISIIAWAGKFRDENNNWSFIRFKERVKLTFSILKDTVKEIQQKDNNSKMLILGLWLFFAGFLIKAFQNISEVFRIPFQEVFGFKMEMLRIFENWTSLGFILIVFGIILLLILHISKKIDLFDFFRNQNEKPHLIQLDLQNNHVINLNNKEQVKNLFLSNPDTIFHSTMNCLLDWHPKYENLEIGYEIKLDEFLSKRLRKQNLSIITQYCIPTARKEKGKVDFAINKSLFIELKREIKGTEKDRSMGQILKYQRMLEKSRTPLILLIVDRNFEKIKEKYTDLIKDYNNKHTQKLLVAVVEPL